MTITTSTNAQHLAAPSTPRRREWTQPVLDILALAEAQAGPVGHTQDAFQGLNRSR
jgi:hypothetical protein